LVKLDGGGKKMSKVIGIRVNDEIAELWKNDDEFKNKVMTLLLKVASEKTNKKVKKVFYFLNGAFKEKSEITALEVFNQFRDVPDIVGIMEQYALENDNVVLESPDPDMIGKLPLNRLLSLVKLRKKGGNQ